MDNCNIKIKINKEEIIIEGLEFSFIDRLKLLFFSKDNKIIFTNSTIIYNNKEL